ncbi:MULTISPECIES: ComEA family DNA-binding protein [Janibacter]|uniref:Competence protein ComEA n=1 Tax=Janibacter indicus TaxID=857417 RepID=A0A1W1YCV9_9MICO|nr:MULTISPECIES: ComEA family DNA-binding protein [Janibacter]SMC33985.1 competence protein ComEA [Janibacter indicus]
MSRRTTEPSERVTEILDESRDPRPLELPSTLAGGRYGVSRQAVIGVALVVALAVAMLAGRFVLAREEAAPEPVGVEQVGQSEPGEGGADPGGAEPGGAGAAASGAAPAGSTAPGTSTGKVTVHVVGQVRRPGIVTLDAGARVADAIDEVGGATGRADLGSVNLARLLVDGEQVVVPTPGESIAAAPAPGAAAPAAGAPAGGAPAGGAAPAAGDTVNLNTADLATLETLPGVGPVLAQRIIDWRTEHGRFTAVEELGEVSGIGDKIYAQLAPKVTV